MPTGFSSSPSRGLTQDDLLRYYEQMRHRPTEQGYTLTTTNTQWATYADAMLQSVAPTSRGTRLKEAKDKDVADLQEFIDTGTSEMRIYMDDNGWLYIYSCMDNLMVVVNSKTIKAHKTKAKHVMKLLTALAEREGLRLKIVDDLNERSGTPVGFWLWKVREEVDDSDLVTVTQARAQERTPREYTPEPGMELSSEMFDSSVPF